MQTPRKTAQLPHIPRHTPLVDLMRRIREAEKAKEGASK